MAEYTVAAILFLVVAVLAAGAVGLLRRRSTWVTLAVFAAFTVVFDIILTGLPIVTYGDDFTIGIAIGPMPIEDLLYGLALALAAMTGSTMATRWRRG